MDPGLKLYVWEDVNCDYKCGIMFALARTPAEARVLIASSGQNYNEDDLEDEPKVYETPVGYSIYGGG